MSQLSNNTIPKTIASLAQHEPGAVALLGIDGQSITYEQLCVELRRVAALLVSQGVRRSDRVAIVAPDGVQSAITFLGAISVAACAPLNRAYSVDDFTFYLRDLRARVLVTAECDEGAAARAADLLKIPIIRLGSDQQVSPEPLPVAIPDHQPEDVALVLHTSGTTSRPKQVPLSHANLAISAGNITGSLRLSRQDCCLNVMPLFHVHGLIGAVLSSLTVGASVVCTPGFSAANFFTWMDQFRPTWFTAVPTMHQALLEQKGNVAAAPSKRQLRFIRSCSSALAPSLMAELERAFGVPVVEAYGMTEAAHQMACNPLPPDVRKAGSVGRATGTEIGVIDQAGNLLGPEQRGEIVVRGGNLTRGYDANPEANSIAFTNGWFRTGDQGHMDSEGYLFLTGRIKEIVNRGGEKISPREVDEVLLEHPAVAQAAAFGCTHPTLGEDLAAVVVLRHGLAATEQELRDFAFKRLTPFKVPSSILITDRIPKGPTGKVQRVMLARQLSDKLRPEYKEPRDEIESLLCDTWAEVLGAQKIGILDNFFTIGGDSLRATQVALRVNDVFGLDWPVSVMFRHPTVEQLASEVRAQANPGRVSAVIKTIQDVARLSDAEVAALLGRRAGQNQPG